jgi:hypothetical protein
MSVRGTALFSFEGVDLGALVSIQCHLGTNANDHAKPIVTTSDL